ncbi:hypothetical protein WT21_19190 [Burkholderia territorii]|nr:hypothetical protein WT21_19190 [Burkholderia territorii]
MGEQEHTRDDHDMTDSSPRRIGNANERSTMRLLSRCAGGNLVARIAMNIKLSMPNAISRTIGAIGLVQIVGPVSHATML